MFYEFPLCFSKEVFVNVCLRDAVNFSLPSLPIFQAFLNVDFTLMEYYKMPNNNIKILLGM